MAFSGIPLPRTVADVGPGGPLVTGLNALNNYELQRSNAQYNPLKTVAQASSQMAYSNLMGPQFLAKLMNNPGFVANSKDPKMLAQYLQEAASQPTGSNALMNPQMAGLMPQPSIGERALNYLLGKVGLGGSSQPQQNNNALLQQPNAPMQNQQSFNPSGQSANTGMSFDKNGKNTVASDDEINAAANRGNNLSPNEQYARNTGRSSEIQEQGKEEGKNNANDIKELNNSYFNAQTKQSTFDDINNMLASPEIREIKQLPVAQRHEMGWYSKFGTPEQKQLVGRLYSQMGNIIKDSSRDFAGQFRKGEQQLLQGMKPSDNDSLDVMIGKAESLSTMNKMLMERTRLTSEYMDKYKINQLEASKMADNQMNPEKIRQDIHNKLNPSPTKRDREHMMKLYNIDEEELDKRLKAKGIK